MPFTVMIKSLPAAAAAAAVGWRPPGGGVVGFI